MFTSHIFVNHSKVSVAIQLAVISETEMMAG